MMASDLISREAALESLELMCDVICPYTKKERDVMCGACAMGSALDVIRDQPPAQPDRSLLFRIGEVCVDESKWEITAEVAVEKIRMLLRAERREE